ncbi:hypothetical protein CH274_05095 [Rhodococcus sp. 06-418-5]|nr:hypothetical protein CH274_04500 [Rhodococcus sp. 06-418-5]OZC85171.1 hypothetical protein CH274_05095 [Rhodococcus sp. 06-418-5]
MFAEAVSVTDHLGSAPPFRIPDSDRRRVHKNGELIRDGGMGRADRTVDRSLTGAITPELVEPVSSSIAAFGTIRA